MQSSLVHTLPSSQGLVPLHSPLTHLSLVVHAMPSLQLAPSLVGVNTQPVLGSQLSVVHAWPSSHLRPPATPAQLPLVHVSLLVHTLPSSQPLPLGLAVFLQPLSAKHTSSVQALPSSQFAEPTVVQKPPWQLSPAVQALPSLQVAPLGNGVNLQSPVTASQPSVVHTRPSWQILPLPLHLPPTHFSPVVHGLPSSQIAPSGAGACAQVPVPSQLSVVHGSLSSQPLTGPPHLPAVHASGLVHATPSLHGLPSAALLAVQLPLVLSQASVVHGLLSLQTLAVPPHTPLVQASPLVQALLSSQTVPSAAPTLLQLPVAASHLSTVHGLLSAQFLMGPAQKPAWHASGDVQASLSLQGVPLFPGENKHLPLTLSQSDAGAARRWAWAAGLRLAPRTMLRRPGPGRS